MLERMGEINWWAVLVATLAIFMLGGIWYMALFGKKWQALHGYTDEQLKEMQASKPPPVFFGVMIVSYFVLSAVMALVFVYVGVDSAIAGIGWGVLLWLGFAATIGMTGQIASHLPLGAYALDVSYQFVYFVMAGAILGAWR